MRSFQNMHTQNTYLSKMRSQKCVFNQKCLLEICTKEEGKNQAKSVKAVEFQAKFEKFCARTYFVNLNYFFNLPNARKLLEVRSE